MDARCPITAADADSLHGTETEMPSAGLMRHLILGDDDLERVAGRRRLLRAIAAVGDRRAASTPPSTLPKSFHLRRYSRAPRPRSPTRRRRRVQMCLSGSEWLPPRPSRAGSGAHVRLHGAVTSVVSLVLMLGGVIVVADGVVGTLGIPFSPFNVMGFPLVLGTGVDALFLMLHHRAVGGRDWIERALLHRVASQLSTSTCFLADLPFPCRTFAIFFVYMIVCTTTTLALQVSWLPALIVYSTRVRVREALDERARSGCVVSKRARRAAPILVALVTWGVLIQYRQPLDSRRSTCAISSATTLCRIVSSCARGLPPDADVLCVRSHRWVRSRLECAGCRAPVHDVRAQRAILFVACAILPGCPWTSGSQTRARPS